MRMLENSGHTFLVDSYNDHGHVTMVENSMENGHVSKSEFKARALEFFRQVQASGESVVVTDHGRPALEVRPFRAKERNPLDVLRGSVVRYDEPMEPVDVEWESAR